MRIGLDSLQPGKTYSFQVRSVNDETYSQWSRTFAIPVTSATGNPPAPEVPTVQVAGDSFIATWTYANKTSDFKHYEVVWNNGSTDSVAQYVTGETFTLVFSDNVLLFGSPSPVVSVKVRAVRRSGPTSSWVQSATAQNPVPTEIPTVTASAGINSVNVSWTAATFDDYAYSEVYAEVGNSSTTSTSKVGRVTGNFFTHPTMSYGAALYYKVKHFDKFNQPSATAGVYLTAVAPDNPAIVDIVPPANPNAATLSSTNDTNDGTGATSYIDVSFNAKTSDSDLAGHMLRYSTTNGSAWTYIDIPLNGTPTGGSAQAVQIKSLFPSKNYYVQTLAYDANNNKSAWVNASSYPIVTAADTTVPPNVGTLTLTSAPTTVFLSWTPLTTADVVDGGSYTIEIDTANTFATGNKKTISVAGTSGFASYSGLSAGSQWYARIKAKDRSGNLSAAWTNSTPTSVTLGTQGNDVQYSDGAAPASSPTPTIVGVIGGLYVYWTAVANNDPVTYEVHLSASSGFTPSGTTKCFEQDGTSGIITRLPNGGAALTPGTTYYVKLIAKDRDGSAAAGTQGSGSFTTISSSQVGFTADTIGGVKVFYQTSTPSHSGAANSAIWYDTDDGYKLYVWNGGSFVASALGSGALGTGSVTGTIIAANTITAGNIVGDTITAAQIASNAITTDELAAGSVTAKHLVIGTLGYEPVNNGFEVVDGSNNAVGWTKDSSGTGSGATVTTTTTGGNFSSGTRGLSLTSIAAGTARVYSDPFPLALNTAYPVFMSATMRSSSGTPAYVLQLITYTDAAGTTGASAKTVNSGTLTTTFAKYGGNLILTADSTVRSARWAVLLNTASATVYVDNVEAGLAVNGTRIADGSITTSMITAGGINASAITAGTITTDRMTAGTIDADRLQTNTLAADTIENNTTFTRNLNVGNASGGGITVTAAGGYIKSSNYSATAGYRLTSSSFELNDGTISAKAIILQDPTNLVPAYYSNLDWAGGYYTGRVTLLTNTSVGEYSSAAVGGAPGGSGRAGAFVTGATAPADTNNGFWLGSSNTDYNLNVEENTTYTFSLYLQGYGVGGTVKLAKKSSAGTSYSTAQSFSAGSISSSANRVSWTFTTGAGETQILLGVAALPASGYWWHAGIQLQKGQVLTPYKMPGQTIIDGYTIRTGQIISTAVSTIGSNTNVPKWSINVQGDAMLNSAVLRGGVVVGVSGDSTNSNIQSADFVTGFAGWRIQYTGEAEFSNLTARAGTGGSGLFTDLTNGFRLVRENLTNLVTNPSFETNTTGWTVSSASTASRTLYTSDPDTYLFYYPPAAGSYALRIVTTAATSQAQITVNTTGLGGKKVTLSWYTMGPNSTTRWNMAYAQLTESGGSARTLSASGYTTNTTAGDWRRLSYTFDLPSDWHTSTVVKIPVAPHNSANTYQSTWRTYIDAVLLTASDEITEYFDGANLGSWTGTAHASTSTRGTLTVVDYKLAPGGTSTLRALDALELKPDFPMTSTPNVMSSSWYTSSGNQKYSGLTLSGGKTSVSNREPKIYMGSSTYNTQLWLENVDTIRVDSGAGFSIDDAFSVTDWSWNSSWTDYGDGYQTLSVGQTIDGMCYMDGVIFKNSTNVAGGNWTTFATIDDANKRPAANVNFSAWTNINGSNYNVFLQVLSTGVCRIFVPTGLTWVAGSGNKGNYWLTVHAYWWI